MAEDDFTPPSLDERVDEPFTPPPVESRVATEVAPQESSLHRILFGRDAAENLRATIQDLVKGVPSMATQAASGLVDVAKFQVGTPQQRTEAIADVVGQGIQQGKQTASDIQAPLGSRESFRGMAELGMLAAPAIGELTGVLRPLLRPREISPTAATEREVIPNAQTIPKNEEINAEKVRQETGREDRGGNVEQAPQGNRTDSGQRPEIAATAPEAFPSISQSAEDARRAELRQVSPEEPPVPQPEQPQIPAFAQRYDQETFLSRPTWVEPGSVLDKQLGLARELPDTHSHTGANIKPIWDSLTPEQRQDLIARGWKVEGTRDPRELVLGMQSDSFPARRYFSMQTQQALKPEAPSVSEPEQPTGARPVRASEAAVQSGLLHPDDAKTFDVAHAVAKEVGKQFPELKGIEVQPKKRPLGASTEGLYHKEQNAISIAFRFKEPKDIGFGEKGRGWFSKPISDTSIKETLIHELAHGIAGRSEGAANRAAMEKLRPIVDKLWEKYKSDTGSKPVAAETPTATSEITPQGQAAPPTEKPPVQAEATEPPPEIPNPVRGSGKFRQTYQVDKELGDRMESIGASKESGALRAEIANRNLLHELTPEQEADLGKYLVSQRLKTLNPEHPQVLSPEETARIESDPAIANALNTYKADIKPEIEALRKQAGLSEEAAAGKEPEFISLIPRPAPEGGGGAVSQASKLGRKTRFAQKAEGQAQEYDTNLRNVLEHSYTEVTRKARVNEFYKAAQRKGLAEPSVVQTANGPRTAVTFNDLPPELQHDLRAATEQELQPTGAAKVLRSTQRFTTGIALTANPAELLNHMRRQLNLVAAKPPIGRGLLSRLEAVVPYVGPKVGTFVRAITDNMSKPENMAVLQDIFDAGGGSSRSFSSMYKSNIPGVRQLQTATHDLLFGIPKGKGIGGWDLRMRVQLEKIRRAAEGNTDPQRIREFANQIGQYGSHPDWLIRGLRTVNPYAATTLPMRLTELKTAVGKSDLQAGGGGKLGRTAETLLRGTGGTLLGLTSANYLLSGKWPWENDKGHEFDLNTGIKGDDGKSIYMKFRVIAPELSRPVQTAALPNLSREQVSKQPQYLSAFLTGLANQGLSLVSGPAQNALLTALTGKAPYITKAPGARPEVMDIAKTEKGGNRGLEQIKHAAAAVNPLGTSLVEEPYHTNVPSPLKYVEQPAPGVRPFGSVFTQSYEKKKSRNKISSQ